MAPTSQSAADSFPANISDNAADEVRLSIQHACSALCRKLTLAVSVLPRYLCVLSEFRAQKKSIVHLTLLLVLQILQVPLFMLSSRSTGVGTIIRYRQLNNTCFQVTALVFLHGMRSAI